MNVTELIAALQALAPDTPVSYNVLAELAPVDEAAVYGGGKSSFHPSIYTLRRQRYPFGRTHINVLALANLKWRRRFESIAEALALCGEQFDGRLHSGADDAFNVAKVLAKVLL